MFLISESLRERNEQMGVSLADREGSRSKPRHVGAETDRQTDGQTDRRLTGAAQPTSNCITDMQVRRV